MPNNNPLLHISGVNSSFHGGHGSFQDYIQHMQNVIRAGRVDLTPENIAKIMAANSPFELRPTNPNKKGILLIHGLYDSPLSIQDIAQHWVDKGYLVRGMLLPGHGTVPGDLLTIRYTEWIKAAHFGVRSFKNQVDELYLAGFSTGGTLVLGQALTHSGIDGLLLFAPALKPKPLIGYFISLHQILLNWKLTHRAWYGRLPQKSYAKYESFNYNAAKQTAALMKKTIAKLKEQPLHLPLFAVVSADDESISPDAVLALFASNNNPKSRLLFYTNKPRPSSDSRILYKSSFYPEQHILNFSHTCITIAPNNPHYGRNGDFRDFQHYGDKIDNAHTQIYQGAISRHNLRFHKIQRLSYNPDFADMMIKTDEFLASLQDNPHYQSAQHSLNSTALEDKNKLVISK